MLSNVILGVGGERLVVLDSLLEAGLEQGIASLDEGGFKVGGSFECGRVGRHVGQFGEFARLIAVHFTERTVSG